VSEQDKPLASPDAEPLLPPVEVHTFGTAEIPMHGEQAMADAEELIERAIDSVLEQVPEVVDEEPEGAAKLQPWAETAAPPSKNKRPLAELLEQYAARVRAEPDAVAGRPRGQHPVAAFFARFTPSSVRGGAGGGDAGGGGRKRRGRRGRGAGGPEPVQAVQSAVATAGRGSGDAQPAGGGGGGRRRRRRGGGGGGGGRTGEGQTPTTQGQAQRTPRLPGQQRSAPPGEGGARRSGRGRGRRRRGGGGGGGGAAGGPPTGGGN